MFTLSHKSIAKAVKTGPVQTIFPRSGSSIPRLTANIDQGYTVTGSSVWPNAPYWDYYYPFSADVNGTLLGANGGWIANIYFTNPLSLEVVDQWIDIALPVARTFTTYGLCMIDLSYGNPVDWKLEGSNNGVNYTIIDTVTGYNSFVADQAQMSRFTIDTPGSYIHYRWHITKVFTGTVYYDSGCYVHDIAFS